MRRIFITLIVLLAMGCESPGTVSISGQVHAGPVCPVEHFPPEPACADRPVGGATLLVLDTSGDEVDRFETDAQGAFVGELPAGVYTLVPQRVEGLLGTAAPIEFTLGNAPVTLDVAYDTGIR